VVDTVRGCSRPHLSWKKSPQINWKVTTQLGLIRGLKDHLVTRAVRCFEAVGAAVAELEHLFFNVFDVGEPVNRLSFPTIFSLPQ